MSTHDLIGWAFIAAFVELGIQIQITRWFRNRARKQERDKLLEEFKLPGPSRDNTTR